VIARLVSRLTCAAGLAAARFARNTRVSQARARQRWHAQMLRWRRPRRALAAAGPRQSRSDIAVVVWQPQWHLHFLERRTREEGRGQAAASPTFTTLRELRTRFVDRAFRASDNLTRSHERAAARLRGRLGQDRRSGGATPRGPGGGEASGVVFARAASPPSVSPLARTRIANSRAVSADERRATRWGVAREFSARDRRRPAGEQAAFVAARRRTRAPSLVWRSPDATPDSPIRVTPSAQMTWRAATASPSGDVDPFATPRAPRSVPVEASTVDGARVATSSPHALNAPSPAQLRDLDPRLIDTLAEDVIRRVERRARIERERRGV